MSFLAPVALAGLLFLPVVVAMYLLKLRRDEAVVPSTLLWQKLVADVEANAPWQKLRRSLLLLLQLLLVLVLAFLAARPFIERPAGLAGDNDFALVRPDDAGDDLHQRRFAGAVLAHQGMDRTRSDPKINPVQGHDAGIALGDAPGFDQIFGSRRVAARPFLQDGSRHGCFLPALIRFFQDGSECSRP